MGDGARDPGRTDAWRPLLRDGSPREILHRLLDGDPLSIWPLVDARLAEHAFFVDPSRTRLRATARVAFDARRFDDREDLRDWLLARAERAIVEILAEQQAEELQSLPAASSEDFDYYQAIGESIGIDADLARLCCARLNGLDAPSRRAFRALAVDGLALEDAVRREAIDAEQLLARFEHAVKAVVAAFLERGEHFDGGPFAP